MNKRSLSIPYIIWAVSFIVIPLFLIIYHAFTNEYQMFSVDNFINICNKTVLATSLLSLFLSAISTFFCLLIGYPTAYFLSKLPQKYGKLITVLLILPMWMNSLLRTMSWMVLLEKKGLINSFLQALNLPTIHIINTPTAVIIGMIYDFLPFMILPIYNSLCKIQQNTIEAAWDLGADGFKTFTKIIFPLSFPGVISGISMVFIPTLTTFAISDLLGGGKILLLGNLIEQQFKQLNDKNVGSALSFILMIFIFLTITITSKVNRNMEDSIL